MTTTTTGKQHTKLLKEYSRPIVHMRQQFCLNRLGLVFGAGLSKSFNLPDWPQLVSAISRDPEVQGQAILRRITTRTSLPYKTELLFQHFRKARAEKCAGHRVQSMEFENRTFADWLKICGKHLYKRPHNDFKKRLAAHPYLKQFIPLIQSAPVTVTYNFDDYLERALSENRRHGDRSRGFETVTNPWMQFRRASSVIYHPNGVIPSELMELPRDRLVFSESSFAKQLVGAFTGDTSFLLNHFCRNTCLIIGSSLEDETLRNVLVQSAQFNPGNCHYYVHYLRSGKKLRPEDADAIRRANFNVFNVVTLFLGDEEIAALAELINSGCVDDNALKDLASQASAKLIYRFYLTGALGAGKSTTASQLRNLVVLDEWLDPRPEILAKPWDTLRPQEKKQADDWITGQFKMKNDDLRHREAGIFIIDRPPLDPLVFTPRKERKTKAQLLLQAMCPEDKWPVADGAIILLKGEPTELAIRVLITGREAYDATKLRQMQEDLAGVYKGTGVIHLDTCGMSIADVTKRVAQIIHFEEYKPFDLHACLTNYMRGRP